MFLFHLHVQPGSLGWMFLPENPCFFFLFAFPWLFPGFEHGKQSTFDRWEELWTNDRILQPKKQTMPPSSNIFTKRFPQISVKIHAIHTKDTNHLNNDHHQGTTRCTGVFSSAKKGGNSLSRCGVGCPWDYIGSLDKANLVEVREDRCYTLYIYTHCIPWNAFISVYIYTCIGLTYPQSINLSLTVCP